MPTIAQQVAAILAGQQAPVSLAFQQANARATRDRRELAATQRALVAQLQRGTGPAGHLYDQAVNQQQALAHAAASELAAASPDAGIQQSLAAIGAPAAQRAMLGAQNQRDFAGQGAVQYTAQGAIPGAGLVAQKAAVQSYLAGLPTVAALAGQQADRALIARQGQSRDQYLQEIARIQGQTPQLVQSLQAAAAEAQRAADEAAATAKYREDQLAIDRYNAQTSRQRAGGGSSPKYVQGSRYGTYVIDPKTGKPVLVIPPAKGAGGAGGAPKGTNAKLIGSATDLFGTKIPGQSGGGARNYASGNKVKQGKFKGRTVGAQRYSRGGAYNVLWDTYAQDLLNSGLSATQVQRMIDDALHTAGYPLPHRGRPRKTGGTPRRTQSAKKRGAPTLYPTGNPLIPLYGE